MPALYSLGQHAALEAVKRRLQPQEELFAYLDDVYVLCKPERARAVFDTLEEELFTHWNTFPPWQNEGVEQSRDGTKGCERVATKLRGTSVGRRT